MKQNNAKKTLNGFSVMHLAVGGATVGVSLGLLALAFPEPLRLASDFTDGLLAVEENPDISVGGIDDLRAEFALAEAQRPLSKGELSELLQGMSLVNNARYDEGIAIVGKYALRGHGLAQYAVGSMYAFGNGLPVDGKEASEWLQLASLQGNSGASQLSEIVRNDPHWNARAIALARLRQSREEYSMEYGVAVGTHSTSYEVERNSYSYPAANLDAAEHDRSPRREALMGDRFQSNDNGDFVSDPWGGPARFGPFRMPDMGSDINTPSLDYGAPNLILNRAGQGTYSDQHGDIYVQAGPNGVVNTRTGEFSTRQ